MASLNMASDVSVANQINQTKNKGGRPKTAWTPRRDQKAVHLYTLTKLTMLEISREIMEDGFAPRYATCPTQVLIIWLIYPLQRKCNTETSEGFAAEESGPRYHRNQAS